MNVFIPKMYKKSIYEIDYKKLKEKGITFLVFDLDNTLAYVNEKYATKEVITFLNNLSGDFQILIASNNSTRRVRIYSEKINCDKCSQSFKPFKRITRYIKRKYKVDMNKVAIIGDQLVTDILMGNRSGMYTILVDPLGDKDLKISKFNRFIEKRIMKKNAFKKGVYYEKE